MSAKKLTLLLFVFSFCFTLSKARADFEVLSTPLNKGQIMQEKGIVAYKKIENATTNETISVSGVAGAAKKSKIKEPKGKMPKLKKSKKLKNNPDENKEAVAAEYYPQYDAGKTVDTHIENKAKMETIQRENLAAIYATAFVTRANLVEEDHPATTQENTRDIIQSIQDISNKSAARISRIVALHAMLTEYEITQKSKKMGVHIEEEDEVLP